MSRSSASASIKKMTTVAILCAIVIVLQIICTFIKFGPFSITLALAPIIIGGALYGAGTGALLGAVFGLVVVFTGLMGWDGGTVMFLFGQSAVALFIICVVRGALAGAISSLVYRLAAKKSALAASIVSGIVCPVANTGLFVLGMSVFYLNTLVEWSNGANMIYYIIFGIAGLNFIVELAVNLVLATGINRIIETVSRKGHH